MKLSYEILPLQTKHVFTIARGGSAQWRNVVVRLATDDGVEGLGEAAASKFYGETAESVCATLELFRPMLERADEWTPETIEAEMHRIIRYNGSAKTAVSVALHDIMGKRLGVPLYKLWGLDPAKACRSSFTIGIGSTAELRQKVAEAAEYPVLKVKLGSDRDEEIIKTVRESAPDKILRVDANAAWGPKRALEMIELLVELDIEFVEQPVPAHDLEALRFVRERSPLPVVADESCVIASDIPKVLGAVDGINIKMAKCGGFKEALKMIGTARAHGLSVMMGCMIESSLGITAAAHLAPLLDYADLDGAALLANDPYTGATIGGGTICIPDGPGLGVASA